jgi:hypothetical protein
MIKHCPQCNTVTTHNKKYCTNACKQKAYRMRRNVTVKVSVQPEVSKPSRIEYQSVLLLINKIDEFKLHIPDYLDYCYIKKCHPELQNVQDLAVVIFNVIKFEKQTYYENAYMNGLKKFKEELYNNRN